MNASTPETLIGATMLLFSAGPIPLQVLVLATLLSRREYRSLTCYQIMISMGVLDVLQLVVLAANGLAILSDCTYDGWVGKWLGAVLIAAWWALIPQHLLLAVNRLLLIWRRSHKSSSSDESYVKRIVNWSLMAACWILGFAVFCLFALDPVANFPYLPNILSFGYSHEPLSRVVAEYDDKIVSSALPLLTCWASFTTIAT